MRMGAIRTWIPSIAQVAHSCTACGAERAERAFAGGGFPAEAGFCPRCATAAIGLFGGHLDRGLCRCSLSLLQAAVADKPGFVAARDEHEAAQAAAADGGPCRRTRGRCAA